ncbi:unnamed protein product [Nippostrongylus brasiliensis]|uniref:Uncharacterized protein n=1 Tax=Nippostrongylus brasiliensis TaxID=27835 RepID=A0A0N4YA32_NIPBR|nr:unnamed protein product [Nippostrongylus brasiliensis]
MCNFFKHRWFGTKFPWFAIVSSLKTGQRPIGNSNSGCSKPLERKPVDKIQIFCVSNSSLLRNAFPEPSILFGDLSERLQINANREVIDRVDQADVFGNTGENVAVMVNC